MADGMVGLAQAEMVRGLRAAADVLWQANVWPGFTARVAAHVEDREAWERFCVALGLELRNDVAGFDVARREFGPVVLELQTVVEREARLRDRERAVAKREAALAAREGAGSV